MKKKSSNEESAPLGDTFVTGAIVVRATLKNFDRLLEMIKTDFPEVKLVYRKVSLGNLYVREEKQPSTETPREYAVLR
ncbi:MAG TPA: hypothetical protein VIH48_02725 [Candidatus Bathyarchaeia archaeon]